MPEESTDINQQPEPTPHFNEFSGHKELEVEPPIEKSAAPNPKIIPPTETIIQPPIKSTSVQNEPMTDFAPNPTINSDFARIDAVPTQPVIADNIPNKKPKWFKRKKVIIGMIAAVLIVAIAGGSTYAYVSYQKPEKVVADSLINALTSKQATYTGKLKFDYSTGTTKVNATVEIKSRMAEAGVQDHNAKLTLNYDKKDYSIEGDALFDKAGDIYFRVNGLASIVSEAKVLYGSDPTVTAAIDKLVKKVDNTWVRVSTEDLKSIDENYSKGKQCINDAIDKFKDDKSATSEVFELYKKHPYVIIKKDLGQVDGSFVYEVEGDTNAGKAFIIGLKDTKIYKSLNSCDKNFVINDSDVNKITTATEDSNTKTDSTFKLSVDVWSHKITKFEATGNVTTKSSYSSDTSKTSTDLLITPDYSQKFNITVPSNSITLTQLKSYFEELSTSIGKYYSSQYNYSSSDYNI